MVPATLEDDSFAQLRLLRSRRVGVVTYYRMLREYGTARAALEALPEVARAAGVKDYRICPENIVQAELRAAKDAGARLITHDSPAYPPHLAELDDAPPFLWAIGDTDLLHRPLVSIVGARNASSLGTRMTRALARGLGEAGFTVVSGLARGIDAAAHQAALETGTIAVQAGGVDVIYPVENTDLAHDIATQGLRLSEQPMGLQPMARHFPSRNRIIAGLARATVVVEAAAKSGSLITARDALDQGRDVLAVPGHPFDARAAGCNMLIRDGATLVRNAADVIALLGPARQEQPVALPLHSPPPSSDRDTASLHIEILSRLGPSPVAEDQLLRDLAVAPAIATPVMVELELNGRILRHAGGLVSRAD
ncbi:DNA-processing protein DprA [Sulfitobacter litoralis]|uniref:DNA-processing protein DprA n=1 Tax=Sulfitobacter litoralis TaxID=335975 RepID=UPI002B276D6A|nr:DNA-processing protein DprA [Sulfitobacter litoralis]